MTPRTGPAAAGLFLALVAAPLLAAPVGQHVVLSRGGVQILPGGSEASARPAARNAAVPLDDAVRAAAAIGGRAAHLTAGTATSATTTGGPGILPRSRRAGGSPPAGRPDRPSQPPSRPVDPPRQAERSQGWGVDGRTR